MGYFADKPKSFFDNLNDSALSFSDNLVKTIFPRRAEDFLKNAIYQNLFNIDTTLDAALFGIQRLKDSITWDECNLIINTKKKPPIDFGIR